MGAGAAAAIEIAFQLLDRGMAYMALINKARAENRDVTDAELDAEAAKDDSARAALQAAIVKAKGEGR